MATIHQAGYVFKDDGTAVSGASVQFFQADTTTSVGSAGTTDSNGYWALNTTTEHASGYDVKITSGSSIRYRRGNDKLQIEELDIRNDTGNTQGGLLVANTTNNASNKVATFANRNTTRADGDEIYISFELNDDGGNIHEFARITAEAVDVSNGSEDGQIRFGVTVAGTMTDVFTINATTAGVSDMTLDVSGDLVLDADGGDVFFKDGGTTFGSATNNSGELIIKSGTTTALTFSGSSVTIGGDLTISGDDLVMATNTSGHVLVADGTNFNPVAVSGEVTMASNGAVTIANDAVSSAKIADDAITSALIADDPITTALIADYAITSALIADGAVTTALIGADAVTNAKIADDAINSEHYTDGSIDTAHIADNNVTAAKIFDLARGSILYGNSSAATAELTKGSANTVLTSDGTDISWAAASSGISAGKALAFSLIF